jgi:hypothetical protein
MIDNLICLNHIKLFLKHFFFPIVIIKFLLLIIDLFIIEHSQIIYRIFNLLKILLQFIIYYH